MKLAGLTGGIGSGKSTVAKLLRARGAVIIDVDRVSRELQQPGRPVFEAMVARWGPAIVAADGTLDRQAVAERVFADRTEMAALMALTSPAIEDALYTGAAAHHDTDDVVLLEAALLVGSPRLYGISGLIVVDVPPEVALQRLTDGRGMSATDAQARMANQPPRELGLRNADLVIDNAGPPEWLKPQLEQAWRWLRSLPDGRIVPRPPA
jgi:dephospho-CoA kinase